MAERKPVIGIIPYKDDQGAEYTPPRYAKGVDRAGGETITIPRNTPREKLDEFVDQLDGMLFPGGVDVEPWRYGAEREPECGTSNPELDEFELSVLEACMRRKMPLLGICRGCQIINVGLGGTLIQDVPKRFGKVHQMAKDAPSPFDHEVRIVEGTMMHEIMGGDISVDSYHHQCVDKLAEGLIATAYAPEGFIEAYEMPQDGDQFLMAVQWHPEVTLDDDVYSIRIFDRFLRGIGEKPKR